MSLEIRVKSNVPFSASPNLDQELSQGVNGILLDRLDFLVEDLGITGTLAFREIQPELFADYPIIFPAGHALPISIEMILKNLTMSGLETVRCAFIYKNKTYEGFPDYDIAEVIRREDAHLRFWTWLDPETKEVSEALFLREAINDIRYIVKV